MYIVHQGTQIKENTNEIINVIMQIWIINPAYAARMRFPKSSD